MSEEVATAYQSSSELKDLSEKISHYIKRVRDVRAGKAHVDAAMFFKSLDAIEKEMVKLKSLYEQELNKVRGQLEAGSREKKALKMQAMQTEAKLDTLTERLASLEAHSAAVEEALRQKESQFNAAMSSEQAAGHSVPSDTISQQKRYEIESLERQAAEERCQKLQQSIDFQDTVHRQEMEELSHRFSTASETIVALEEQLRNSEKDGPEFCQMLEEIREATEKDMKLYKKNAEIIFNQSVKGLESQIEADSKTIVNLKEECTNLTNTVDKLNYTCEFLQSEKQVLRDKLEDEKKRNECRIEELESQLQAWRETAFGQLSETTKETCPAQDNTTSNEVSPGSPFPPATCTDTPREPRPYSHVAIQSPTPHVLCTSIVESVTNEEGTVVSPEGSYVRQVSRPVSAAMRPVGPIRPQSAPVGPVVDLVETMSQKDDRASERDDVQTPDSKDLGKGKDYFKEMFEEKERSRNVSGHSGVLRTHDYNFNTNSATGPLHIAEVHPEGKYIRLTSDSARDVEIGGYTIQQNVGGNPVALYRFPGRLALAPGTYVTVYSGSNNHILHQPPTDFVWKEQDKWGTGPECTTIVCKSNGQAVAWSTSAHRFGGASPSMGCNPAKLRSQLSKELPLFEKNTAEIQPDAPLLKREKVIPPSLTPPRHPHGETGSSVVHPSNTIPRQLTPGNDNSSNNRQTRSQSARPDPLPDEPYAGRTGQRMGSAPYRRFTPLSRTKESATYNQCSKSADFKFSGEPPSPFLTPHAKFYQGIAHIQAQHNQHFYPPTPKSHLLTTW